MLLYKTISIVRLCNEGGHCNTVLYIRGTNVVCNLMITTIDPGGKYLAGLNGVTGTFQGQKLSGETYMKLAGAYQQRELFKTTLGVPLNAIGIITKGTAYGPPPYYGEQPYSGRMILKGIQSVNLRP